MAIALNKKYMEFPLLILACLLLMTLLLKEPAKNSDAVTDKKKDTMSVIFPFPFGAGPGSGF